MYSLFLCLNMAVLAAAQFGGKSYGTQDPVVKYAADNSVNLTPAQQGLMQATLNLSAGGMMGAPEVIQLNMMLMHAINAVNVLDVGLFTGFSALGAALAIPPNGKVIGMDLTDNYWRQVNSERYMQEAGVRNKIQLELRPAQETMQRLIQNGTAGTWDFCFIDADKASYDTYYEQCLTLLRPKGIISIDNMLWGGSVVRAGQKYGDTQVIDNLNKKIHADSRVWATLLTTGDGVMLAVKK